MNSKLTIYAPLRVVLYAIPVVAAALVIERDAGTPVDGLKFGESSNTELMQQFFLLFTCIAFLTTGLFSKSHKAITHLLGGCVLVALIRELDTYFDQIYHGAWFPVASLIGAITIFSVWRRRKKIWGNLEEFFSTPAFGIILSGFLSVFIFSRIFGSKNVWRALFDVEQLGATQRWVKNAAEEGSELFGYTLLLIAAVEFFVHVVQPLWIKDTPEDKAWLVQQLTPR